MDTQWRDQKWAEIQVTLRRPTKPEHSGADFCLPSEGGGNVSVDAIWARE